MYGRGVGCLLLVLLINIIDTTVNAECDPRLPHCKDQAPTGVRKECNPFWLIPGKANECTKPSSKKLILLDANSVSISPNPIKLPGCFTINMKFDIQETEIPKSFFSKVEYNWFNVPQFSSLPCQNASSNGCGGFGNNCYYCDICNNLQSIDDHKSKSQIVSQFKNIECPQKAGSYNFKREFCFNDFSDLDKDHDCQLDFLQNGQAGENYKDALKNVQQAGFGTVVAKFTLSNNATTEQAEKKKAKEADLEKTIKNELEQERLNKRWAVDDEEYKTFSKWYVKYRKDTWHKQEFLPWLLYYNEIGCMTVSFDVCDKQPTPTTTGANSFQCV